MILRDPPKPEGGSGYLMRLWAWLRELAEAVRSIQRTIQKEDR